MGKATAMSIYYILKRSMYLPKHTLDKRSNSKQTKILIFSIAELKNKGKRKMTSFVIQNFWYKGVSLFIYFHIQSIRHSG
jgi:hypothetical protein